MLRLLPAVAMLVQLPAPVFLSPPALAVLTDRCSVSLLFLLQPFFIRYYDFSIYYSYRRQCNMNFPKCYIDLLI